MQAFDRFLSAAPPEPAACRAISFNAIALSLMSIALAPRPMTSSTFLSSSTPVKTPSPFISALTPTPHASSTRYAFVVWSSVFSTETTGTPAATASTVEFQPQCETKHPTAGCDSTSSWSHQSTTIPCWFSKHWMLAMAPPSPSPSSWSPSLRTTSRNGRAH
ncbi:hypothetical protein U9M48_005306 [Paspalum notatum var. saurae]|uniref:Uncharacterized protein n=1 Tax=Paspalum notatum var. saurae TaxID=547442 RepID=A0AAQ3PQJ5_PASNO